MHKTVYPKNVYGSVERGRGVYFQEVILIT